MKAVDISDFVPPNPKYLAVLSSSALSLTEILLDDSLSSCDGIGPLIVALGPTLTFACFGNERKIDTPTLNLIATTCKQIKELSIVCELHSSQDYITPFASGYLPLLQKLEIVCDGPHQPSEETVKAFVLNHPLLISVDFQSSAISPKTCANIISSNPQFVHFRSDDFLFDVVDDDMDSQQSCCEITLEQWDVHAYPSAVVLDCILQISSSYSHPLTHVECDGAFLTNEDLLTAMSVLGKDLKSFAIDLNCTADDDNVVQQMTLQCPRLKSLFLCSTDNVTDVGLYAIANNCKFITMLSLHEGSLLTDFGMCYLLNRIGEQLVELHLVGCSLTSASLVPILVLCNKLEILDINESGIPSEDIQVHLISFTQDRLPKLEKLLVDADAFDDLMDYVFNPVNAVDPKWTRIVELAKYSGV